MHVPRAVKQLLRGNGLVQRGSPECSKDRAKHSDGLSTNQSGAIAPELVVRTKLKWPELKRCSETATQVGDNVLYFFKEWIHHASASSSLLKST